MSDTDKLVQDYWLTVIELLKILKSEIEATKGPLPEPPSNQ